MCILSKSSNVFIKNHFTFVQSINTASAFLLFGTSTMVLDGDGIFTSNVNGTHCNRVGLNSKTAISGRENSTIIVGGTVVFNEFCAPTGASIHLRNNSRAIISGNASFSQNTANVGGAIAVEDDGVLVINGTVAFSNNTAGHGGAIYLSLRGRGVIVINGTIAFTYNTAVLGGAIFFSTRRSGVLLINGKVAFIDNTAESQGGAIYLSQNGKVHLEGEIIFKNNTSNGYGGALHGEGSINLQGFVTFVGNSASDGGAISSPGLMSFSQGYISSDPHGALYITGKAIFMDNRASNLGGAIFLFETRSMHIQGDVTFINNTAYMGGAICAIGLCSLSMQDNITFVRNAAYNGGAMAILGYLSFATLQKPSITHITLINNTADQYGGALFLSSRTHLYFIHNNTRSGNVFNFTNNTASDSGDAIFGMHFHNFTEVSHLFYFSPSFAEDPSVISSYPTGLCFFKESFNCSLPSPSYAVYPGESFEVSIAVVGELQGLVKSSVQASIYNCIPADIFTALGNLQHVQTSSSRKCTTFQYSIFTNNTSNFVCGVKFMTGDYFLSNLTVHVLSCPIGFELNSKTRLCDCVQPLEATGTVNCNVSGKFIQRQGTTWIGVLKWTNHTSLVYSTTCPFSYCVEDNTSLNISLFPLKQDAQCGDFRSGILCGSCRTNYSLALGSNRCLPGCTNYSLSLIIAFAAAGIVLIFFIKILNLTVSQGTLNGLIFYANIIGAHPTLFFPTRGSTTYQTTSTLLSTFIA